MIETLTHLLTRTREIQTWFIEGIRFLGVVVYGDLDGLMYSKLLNSCMFGMEMVCLKDEVYRTFLLS